MDDLEVPLFQETSIYKRDINGILTDIKNERILSDIRGILMGYDWIYIYIYIWHVNGVVMRIFERIWFESIELRLSRMYTGLNSTAHDGLRMFIACG